MVASVAKKTWGKFTIELHTLIFIFINSIIQNHFSAVNTDIIQQGQNLSQNNGKSSRFRKGVKTEAIYVGQACQQHHPLFKLQSAGWVCSWSALVKICCVNYVIWCPAPTYKAILFVFGLGPINTQIIQISLSQISYKIINQRIWNSPPK